MNANCFQCIYFEVNDSEIMVFMPITKIIVQNNKAFFAHDIYGIGIVSKSIFTGLYNTYGNLLPISGNGFQTPAANL